MKKNSCFLIVLLVLSTLLMTAAGIVGRKGVYARYNYKPFKDGPILTLTLRGFSDDISPLEVLGPPFEKKRETADEKTDSGLKYFTTPSSSETGATGTGASADASAEGGKVPGDATGAETTESADPADTTQTPPPTGETPADPGVPPADPGTAPADPAAGGAPGEVPGTTPPAGAPVAAGTPADDAYYADALFIGDSRTVGLSQYVPGLDAYATFYCKTSLNVFNALDTPMVQLEDGLQTAETALSRRQFGKIYISLGINEIGYGSDAFISSYVEVLNRIRALQPTAVIYVQGIMHVSSSKTAENPVFNNAAVNERNARLAALANGTDLIYMDINYLLDDANGALNGAYTFDGVHLTADSYALWYQEIKEQTR